jgi:putative thioredoxin
VHATDATFESVVNASLATPLVLVLWTPQVPESLQHLRELAQAARDQQGRFQVVGVDLGANPGVMQALTPIMQQVFGQVSALPVVMGLLGGQPMPFYLGVQPMEQVHQLLDKFIEAAVTNAITGRVDVSGDAGEDPAASPAGEPEEEGELPPLHQEAYDAIDRGDWAAAVDAYERALAQDPGDEMARLGLGQVTLLERTSHLDLVAVRAAAAERPDDVQAQIEAADLDLVGGHVEDGFLRLVDTVRRTSGADRDRARMHLIELFEVIGSHDPRVAKGRQALMSALF